MERTYGGTTNVTVLVLWAGHFQFQNINIFSYENTEVISSNSTGELLWFESSKMLIAVLKINLLCYLL